MHIKASGLIAARIDLLDHRCDNLRLVLSHALPSYCASYRRAYHDQEGWHFHSKDYARRSVVVAVGMLARVFAAVVARTVHDRVLVGYRVVRVIVFESVCRRDFRRIVILV